ncbi:MAG: hypothetical protein ABW167_09115 [Baekduia sp.]
MLALLQDEAEAIRLEPPGPEGDGVEFWLRYPEVVEYHQVKRQRTGEGRWSLSALRSVLVTFLEKLQDPNARCVFVSGHSAHVLESLAMRADAAVSRGEFAAELSENQTWKAHYDELLSVWGDPPADVAFDALRRIRVRTIGEAELASWNVLETSVVLAGDQSHAVAVVTEIVRDHASAFLTAAAIWGLLEPKGYTPNPWRSSRSLTEQVSAANERFISSRERTLIGRELIERPEAGRLGELVEQQSLVILDGAAGAGKSDVLLQFVRGLISSETPFLAFRLDRSTPTLRSEVLGEELGLPGSPAAVIAAHAQRQTGVLVIDQLDIVSTTSGRSPEFFDCVLEIIELAASVPNLRVVLSCRTFDIENDSRLRRLIPATDPRPVLTVGPLGDAQVTAAVSNMGLDPDTLTATQRTILAVPLHLALLSEVLGASGGQAVLDFTTAGELYEKFWDAKQRELRDRLGRVPAWTEILDRLVDDMSENQLLRVPRELVDEWQLDVEAMVSCRVLTSDGAHLAFFHETYFDYVFARRFAARRQTVSELLSSDQFLFRRAQIRQILAYNRSRGTSYRNDLAYLLGDERVRFHLRDLVVSWLAQVDPSEDEWDLLQPHLDDAASPLHSRAWQTLGSVAWLRLADARGYLEACLAGSIHVDAAVTAIGLAGPAFADRAVELLRPYLVVDDEESPWAQRILWIIRHVDLGESDAMYALFLEMLDSGALDRLGVTGQDFWYIAHDLPKSAPAQANELLGHYLQNRLAAAKEAGVGHPFVPGAGLIPGNTHLLEYVTEAAQGSPAAFVQHVWPRMLDIVDGAVRLSRDGRLSVDDVWSLRHFGDVYGGLDDHLLLGAEAAFRALARDSPAEFAAVAEAQCLSDSETVVFLLFEGYSAHPTVFADDALDSLTDDPRRLRVGYSDGDEWQTRRLLEAVTPSASVEAIDRLEPTLLSYYTPWEKSVAGHREIGATQFALLGGVEAAKRTPAMRKRFAEWQRKFLQDDALPPTGIISGFVESPIDNDAAAKMSDKQWLNAMRRYHDDDFRNRRELLLGGADQLSNVLEARTKLEPERFAALARRMADDTNVSYFEAILRGVVDSESGASFDATLDLMLRCHELPGRPTGRWIARPLRHHFDESWPDVLVDLLVWYATKDPDPEADPIVDAESPGREPLAQRGLNSVRGGVAYEISRIVWFKPDVVDRLAGAIDSLVTDATMAVRSMAAEIPRALLRDDASGALELLDALLTGGTDDLFRINAVTEVMRYRLGTDFARLLPHIERMIASADAAVQANGAAIVSIAALDHDDARQLADACAQGNEPQRVGVAKVCAANLTAARFRGRCEQQLVEFFDDSSKEVRSAAASVVRRLEGDEMSELRELLAAFNRSEAGRENFDDLLYALTETTSFAADVALDTCSEVLDQLAQTDRGARVVGQPHADQVSQILVRAYADGDGAVMNRALDLIDRSLELNIYGTLRALADHDRPWLAGGP